MCGCAMLDLDQGGAVHVPEQMSILKVFGAAAMLTTINFTPASDQAVIQEPGGPICFRRPARHSGARESNPHQRVS
jgi:hypothetical protein